ncbi:mitomycin antibiotic biosynthesis protein [Candidatus Poribacteria bacterium]|jgi:phytanoyl-CoA hydroxylase|nr:mitomycin antibiotic biosynthesis protein [Candidatus Poribacteria bacterium]MBT5533164.1 mitomycin antibiotic biosynthesis protein [Candidatus Poribacteria bacterium]MBT5711002.1 mitomycin antibiotic biosynthesis protein [Candidatus Poribacteria bacterium]MBT7097409.1 mitomycin antibiotic biosynthesis protein [Candidatus Poribacteria bacterium]MBT7803949.1 mitomycin antibiotic biosynthesis protein [Candidatus Poribacteria bacterium]
MKLSDDQVRRYWDDGCLLAEGVLSDADTQPLIDELCEWIDKRAASLHADGKLSQLHEDAPFETRYGRLVQQTSEMGRGMDIMHMRGAAMFQFLHNAALLDAVSSLVGDEITCNPIQHVRAKPPAGDADNSWSHGVPWHQDAAVMMPEAEGSNVVTCWIPLGDSTSENGCVQVLPGVAGGGYIRHQKEGGTMIVPDLQPDVEPVFAECRRGDVLFISRYTPHASVQNRSDRCRWSLDLRYQPTGEHTGRTAHPDFVVQSASNPGNVMDDVEEWRRLWIDAFENPSGAAMHREE